MNVTDACHARVSVRAFKPDPVPAETLREILEVAARGAPSGGNLQPWRVYALSGAPLQGLKGAVAGQPPEGAEYNVYPPELWEPFRTHRFQCGEDLYGVLDIPREDRPARLRQIANNARFFGAPIGLFFAIDRNLGPPQWADLGMFMQTIMLLAVERGLDSCAQEFWAGYPRSTARAVDLRADQMIFAGMALGYRDADHPINTLSTRRDPVDAFATLIGF